MTLHAEVGTDREPYGRMLPGIRGVRLAVVRVDAKFRYDDANPVDHRKRVIGYLEVRGGGSMQGRRGSNGGASPRSGIGRPIGVGDDGMTFRWTNVIPGTGGQSSDLQDPICPLRAGLTPAANRQKGRNPIQVEGRVRGRAIPPT